MFCLYVYICTFCVPGACGAQKRALDPLALKLQMVWATICATGTQTGSSEGAESTLNYGDVSAIPRLLAFSFGIKIKLF